MTTIKPTEIEDSKQYQVTLSQPIELWGQRIYPSDQLTMKGDLLKLHLDEMAEFVEVQNGIGV